MTASGTSTELYATLAVFLHRRHHANDGSITARQPIAELATNKPYIRTVSVFTTWIKWQQYYLGKSLVTVCVRFLASHLKSSIESSAASAAEGAAPLPSAEGGAMAGIGLPAARRASVGSWAEDTWATCLRMRKRSYSASSSSLSGSSLEAPT